MKSFQEDGVKSFCALVPMKGDSERIPNKNMRSFDGHPLCYYILSLLEQNHNISRILVNTDSLAITEYVQENFSKAEVLMRPHELRGNNVPMDRLIKHDIELSGEEYFFQSFSTCPLLKNTTIQQAIDVYKQLDIARQTIYSVSRIQKRLYRADGTPLNHDATMLGTQDIPPVFERNALFYIFSRTAFFNNGENRISRNSIMYETGKIESIDIDEPEDFIIAEILHRALPETKSVA